MQAKAEGPCARRSDPCCQELSRVACLRQGLMLAAAFELREVDGHLCCRLRLLLLGKGGDWGERNRADDGSEGERLRPCAHRARPSK